MTAHLDTQANGEQVPTCVAEELKDLHVRVPLEAWRRARIAALQSGLSFKDYLTCILLQAKPIDMASDKRRKRT